MNTLIITHFWVLRQVIIQVMALMLDAYEGLHGRLLNLLNLAHIYKTLRCY